ncbi:MAG: tetratricopeptide repeat protein [Gemmatimonadaceae bacterium]
MPPGDVVAPPRGAGGRSEEERAAAGKKAAWFNTASLLSVALVGAALPPDALFTADWWLAVGAVVTGLFGLVRARWLGGRGRTLSRFALLGGLGLSIAGPIANPAPLPEWAVDLGARVGLPVGLPPQVTRGIEAYRAGDRERAKREFTEAAQLYPRSAVALVYLARMRRQDGDADGGAELLRTALARDPEAGVIHHDLGTYHIERARRYQARGETRYADQEYEEAGRYLSTALRINPSYASASGYIACALVGLGRTQEAEYYASRAGDGPWRACLAPAAPTPAAPPLSPGRPRGGAR